MRTDPSTWTSSLRDKRPTHSDATYLPPEDLTATDTRAEVGSATRTDLVIVEVSPEPDAGLRTKPGRGARVDERGSEDRTLRLQVRGSIPPPVKGPVWIAPAPEQVGDRTVQCAAAPAPRPVSVVARASRLGRGSSELRPIEPVREEPRGEPRAASRESSREESRESSREVSLRPSLPPSESGALPLWPSLPPGESGAAPRASVAPPFSLVAGSGPQPALRAQPVEPDGERPIAWGRVVAAIALMSALIGGAVARFAYHPRSAPAASPGAAPAASVAAIGVAVLPFEIRSSDPALRDASQAFARVLTDELAARTMLEVAAPATGASAVVRGSLADEPGGGVRLRIELVRAGGKPVTVLDRSAAPGELAATVRAGVPAFAGLLVDPRELPRHLELGRRALVEDRLAAAVRHLDTILLHDPGHREARYERALAARWSEPAAAAGALREALAAQISPLHRDVLAAHLQLAEGRHADALAAFSVLAVQSPQDLHVLFGLFQSQLLASRGAEAMVTYRRLLGLDPRVRLGMRDVLAYAAAHPDAADLAWVQDALPRDRAATP